MNRCHATLSHLTSRRAGWRKAWERGVLVAMAASLPWLAILGFRPCCFLPGDLFDALGLHGETAVATADTQPGEPATAIAGIGADCDCESQHDAPMPAAPQDVPQQPQQGGDTPADSGPHPMVEMNPPVSLDTQETAAQTMNRLRAQGESAATPVMASPILGLSAETSHLAVRGEAVAHEPCCRTQGVDIDSPLPLLI